MRSPVPRVTRLSPDFAWRARVGDDAVGGVKAFVRPDERRFVFFESCRPNAYEPLLAAVAADVERDLYVTLGEGDDDRRGVYEQLGFAVNRRESHYLLATDPAVTRLRDVKAPPGFSLVSAIHVDEHRLRLLDDTLRQDVPGTDGWRWNEAAFRAETFESPAFDPATYLIAVEDADAVSGGETARATAERTARRVLRRYCTRRERAVALRSPRRQDVSCDSRPPLLPARVIEAALAGVVPDVHG